VDAYVAVNIGSGDVADRDVFVSAMRGAVTGVNVVTTDGPAGRFGLTVSAFSSVSADPPIVLVCINRRSRASAAVLENGRFCVNVLSTEQRHLADIFAGHPTEGAPYDFAAARWNEVYMGVPSLVGAIASFHCTVEKAVDSGTHTVFIGRVTDVAEGTGRALLYTDRAYGRACAGPQIN
jgi:flavin reductase